MRMSGKVLFGGIIIALALPLGGCGGGTYYRGYYDPYPNWRHTTVIIRDDDHHHHHRPPGYRPGNGGHRPSIGRPVQLPARPKPRPPGPMPRPMPRRR